MSGCYAEKRAFFGRGRVAPAPEERIPGQHEPTVSAPRSYEHEVEVEAAARTAAAPAVAPAVAAAAAVAVAVAPGAAVLP